MGSASRAVARTPTRLPAVAKASRRPTARASASGARRRATRSGTTAPSAAAVGPTRARPTRTAPAMNGSGTSASTSAGPARAFASIARPDRRNARRRAPPRAASAPPHHAPRAPVPRVTAIRIEVTSMPVPKPGASHRMARISRASVPAPASAARPAARFTARRSPSSWPGGAAYVASSHSAVRRARSVTVHDTLSPPATVRAS